MKKQIDQTLGGQLDKIIQMAAQNLKESMVDWAVPALCESEIEGALGAAFYACEAVPFYTGTTHHYVTHEWMETDVHTTFEEIAPMGLESNKVAVFPQVKIGQFRVDFLCALPMFLIKEDRFSCQYLAVECDGHDFHEKTKEQAARDKARDRALLINGVPSMRFSGSEIWRDVFACVKSVDDFFVEALSTFRHGFIPLPPPVSRAGR